MGCVAFHIGFLKKESACCESLSHASGVPAPFGKGAFGFSPLRTHIISLAKYPPSIYGALSQGFLFEAGV